MNDKTIGCACSVALVLKSY